MQLAPLALAHAWIALLLLFVVKQLVATICNRTLASVEWLWPAKILASHVNSVVTIAWPALTGIVFQAARALLTRSWLFPSLLVQAAPLRVSFWLWIQIASNKPKLSEVQAEYWIQSAWHYRAAWKPMTPPVKRFSKWHQSHRQPTWYHKLRHKSWASVRMMAWQ